MSGQALLPDAELDDGLSLLAVGEESGEYSWAGGSIVDAGNESI